MLIGAMNNPARDVFSELKWMAELRLDFVDLTLEPPGAAPWMIDPEAVRSALRDLNLGVVGHTAYYLPFASPFELIRRAAVEEARRCLDFFARIGARWMNIHPDAKAPQHSRAFVTEQNLKSIRELLPSAREHGIGLMVENTPGGFNSRAQLSELLDPVPELGLHLDLGHCNLQVPADAAGEIIRTYGGRIQHVHMHDNKGGSADLHLPLGTGTVDFEPSLEALRSWGYDGTFTLEVFTPDRQYLSYSREVLQRAWEKLRARKPKPMPLPA